MTTDKLNLENALSKLIETQGGDLLRNALSGLLSEMMRREVEQFCGAGYNERSEKRETSRNGYRERLLSTRLGDITLEIPKLRSGSYFPSFLNPRRRWEKAFVNVISEAYLLGVSTRKVENLMESMGATGVSRSEVSRVSKMLDDEVEAFRTRSLTKRYTHLYLDATYLKSRVDKRTCSRALLIACAVSEDGEREIIGVSVTESESTQSWREFFISLIQRGLTGVQLVISDAHLGLRAAIESTLTGVSWQRCRVHFMREALKLVKHAQKKEISAKLRSAFEAQPTLQEGETLNDRELGEHRFVSVFGAFKKLAGDLESSHPKLSKFIDEGVEDVLTYLQFPEAHHRKIYSTNLIERINREIKRRSRVVSIFPNDAAVLRLITMILIEQDDEWSSGYRYLPEIMNLNTSSEA
jgi:transposase-like protein|tara:strand:+ start:158 stop:1390 length:1233 start_codon:yes stop_codon:yes gene_type:complete